MIIMFQNRETIPKPSFQVLPKNILDIEVQRIAYSYNFAFNLFCSSKHHIRDNHVYPNGKKYYLMSFLYMMVLNSLSILRMWYMDFLSLDGNDDHLGNGFTVFLTLLFCISFAIGFTMQFFLNIVHKNKQVLLILKIQTIHKSLHFSKNIHNYIIWNWISILTTIFCEILICCYDYGLISESHVVEFILDFICDVMFITFDIHVVVAIRLIILFRKYVDEWIKDILKLNDEQENDEQCEELFGIYQHILKAYNLYKAIFQVLILYQIIQAFLRSITICDIGFYDLRALSESEQYTLSLNEASFFGLISAVYITRNTIFVILHSIYCEKFYISVEEAQMACIQLMKKRNCPKSHKHLCMNVILANQSFSKMSACGLFCVDATLTIGLMGVIIHYVLVLLQFFFL